ncbi:MAG TPA: outer membrane protein transport protein [Polyangiaceae bacterium]
MRTIRVISTGWAMAWLASSAVAWANTEPPPAYDARSVGMGSTGVAHVHNGASLYHNPAALQGVENGAVTLDFAPLAPQMSAPLSGPETEGKSKRAIFPMFLVGGAYRVNEQLTLGLAVFPTMGFGAKYTSVPMLGGALLNAKLAAVEIAPGAAFALTRDIAIGATYRVTYMSYGQESPVVAPDPAPPGTLIPTKLDISGWGLFGVQLGVFARATKTTRLGLTYRNKVSVNMGGSTKMAGQSYDTHMEFASPHTFKLGVAQSLLDEKLLLTLDCRLSLYHESAKSLEVKTDIPGVGTQSTVQSLDWKNTLGIYAGGEYRFAPQGLALRLGYSLAQSATSNSLAQPILPPPGVQHAFHAGAGVAFSKIDVDVGGYYMFGGGHQPDAVPTGDYKMNAILVALSGNYRW